MDENLKALYLMALKDHFILDESIKLSYLRSIQDNTNDLVIYRSELLLDRFVEKYSSHNPVAISRKVLKIERVK